MFGSLKPPASLWNGHSETNNGFHYLIAHALNSPIDSPHAPHGQASVNQGVAIFSDCAVTLSSTGAINPFKEMTPATSGVIARFPLLFPIRNSFEFRGLYRRSYFGPRTCGGSITIVIEVGRVLNPGFPFSPLNVHFCVQSQAQRC